MSEFAPKPGMSLFAQRIAKSKWSIPLARARMEASHRGIEYENLSREDLILLIAEHDAEKWEQKWEKEDAKQG